MSRELECDICDWKGLHKDLNQSLCSIIYRPKEDAFRVFHNLKCPRCNHIITILISVSKVVKGDLYEKR